MIDQLRPVCISIAVAVLTAIVVYIGAYLVSPVTGIRVEGARLVPETQVWSSVSDRASLLTMNSELLERKLKSNPWVKGIKMSKDWRSGIVTVKVEERRPVLKRKAGGRETLFSADGVELPHVGGTGLPPIELDERRLESILSSGRVLDESGAAVQSINEAGPGGVEALVEGRRIIFSGEIRPGQASALPEIIRQNPEAQVFDLRSPERIVVEKAPSGNNSGD